MAYFTGAVAFFCSVRWMCEQRKQQEEARILAKEKHSKLGLVFPHLFKIAWFAGIVTYEWQTFSQYPWFPKFLGGVGRESAWDDDLANDLEVFYEIQMAYHCHSMIFSFLVGSKLEMHVHHIVTIMLIFFSNYYGYRRSGSIVFLLHDTPDIVGHAIKAAVIAEDIYLTLVLYIALLVTWSYFRLYLLPLFIVDVTHSTVPPHLQYFFIPMLATLVMLHLFWFFQFLLIAYNFRKSGKVRDISEKTVHPADISTVKSKLK
jgi:hypothetical protein